MTEAPEQGSPVGDIAAGMAEPSEAIPRENGDPVRPSDESVPEQEAGIDADQIRQLKQIFNGPVIADGGRFGIFTHPTGPGRREGRIGGSEIGEILAGFVPPEGYDAAFEALSVDHVVVLRGRTGTGKRTGALSLLREVMAGDLFVLPPMNDMAGLADREYEAGNGYLLEGVDGIAHGHTEFNWRRIRDRLRAANAWLVVTDGSAETPPSDPVVGVAWVRPDPRALLTAWFGVSVGRAADARIGAELDAVVAELPDDFRVAELREVARRVFAGEGASSALRVLDFSAQKRVREWFDSAEARTTRQLLEVTVLVFLDRVGIRLFETLLERLEHRFAEPSVPEPEEPVADGAGNLPDHRRALFEDTGLIRVTDGGSREFPKQWVEFREASYRRYVLVELWKRMDTGYWDTVCAWVGEVITGRNETHTSLRRSVADALGVLASVAVEEVQEMYLVPWSKGKNGVVGRNMAVLVLWSMCFSEQRAPFALRTAVKWAEASNRAQRLTAALAFSGELGVTYPDEACRQLWRLVIGSDDPRDRSSAQASLVAMLTDDSAADAVLAMLEDEHRRDDADRRDRPAAMNATAALLTCPDDTGMDGARLMAYVHRHRERLPRVAGLWALLLRYRPCRRRALDGLLSGLGALAQHPPAPEETARELGAALAAELPARERVALVHDLTVRLEWLTRRRTNPSIPDGRRIDALVRILLTSVETDHSMWRTFDEISHR
ncbi:hypothetical protein [Nocardia paucivorans]|uniref:hypothetical protein n=1 Tax=Nocardia paucivorans TaxID=114259 RepID=UPI0005927F8E|nr:hypothetical protein [Nocardia paucivorans]